ncbi:exosortase family protein XrtF [Hymenobacter daecheongensis DSM 21074]|uniref:Exosortase family protein XrtF n=1 Tax=Hymenobacter daecheongensis DSM 21074 TaxID=1121955 RepID=A0A1M6LD53_9BACT|nr:archaeosortase/exosortase family protein [Hymenobacter daecheongensis]SHJ69140.1 exosortase family protein XrtF [Hymenobacter daecheongensis DSM 21074]
MAATSISAPTAPPLRRFLLLATVLYILWFVGYEQWLAIDGRLDAFLSTNITAASALALRLFGFQAQVDGLDPYLLRLNGQPMVHVGHPCNGLVLYALFAGFVLAYPGPVRRKLWYIPLGILAIYLLNVIRIGALALNHLYYHQSVEFNHHYTFTFVVYACIFLLWMLWARRLADQPAVSRPAYA